MMRYIYGDEHTYIYGTFEKESQWRGASDRSGHIYVIYIYQTYIDAEFDVESFGMVYFASKGRLGKVICEKHTFLNSRLSPTVRVSQVRESAIHDVRSCAASESRKLQGF